MEGEPIVVGFIVDRGIELTDIEGEAGAACFAERLLAGPGADEMRALGWEVIAPQTEVIPTPGTHFSLLDEPCIHVTIAHLCKILSR